MLYKVYRYEEQFGGEGPYTCRMDRTMDYTVCEAISEKHCNTGRPSIRIDGLDFAANSGDEFRTACNSLKELKNWFKGFNKWLLESGFILVEYTVSKKFDGDSKMQCVFHKTAIIEKKIIVQKFEYKNCHWERVK